MSEAQFTSIDDTIARASAASKSRPILVVDDDGDIRDAVCELLEQEGFFCVPAINGKDALARLRTLDPYPRVVLLDLMMPVMNGWEFCEHMTKDGNLPPVRIVIMTAHGGDTRTGALTVLRKPLDLDRLLSAMAECT